MFSPEHFDNCGRVRVWNLETGEWMVRSAVDAREMVTRGIAALTSPEGVPMPEPKPVKVAEKPKRGRPRGYAKPSEK